jgi:hypothetical protein
MCAPYLLPQQLTGHHRIQRNAVTYVCWLQASLWETTCLQAAQQYSDIGHHTSHKMTPLLTTLLDDYVTLTAGVIEGDHLLAGSTAVHQQHRAVNASR